MLNSFHTCLELAERHYDTILRCLWPGFFLIETYYMFYYLQSWELELFNVTWVPRLTTLQSLWTRSYSESERLNTFLSSHYFNPHFTSSIQFDFIPELSALDYHLSLAPQVSPLSHGHVMSVTAGFSHSPLDILAC